VLFQGFGLMSDPLDIQLYPSYTYIVAFGLTYLVPEEGDDGKLSTDIVYIFVPITPPRSTQLPVPHEPELIPPWPLGCPLEPRATQESVV